MKRFLYWASHTLTVVLGMLGIPIIIVFMGVGFGLMAR